MFARIRPEFDCLQGQGKNSNVWKDKVKILMFARIRPEFQCLQG